MSNVFSEVYGTYYNVVAKVLTQAVQGKLSLAQLQQIVSSEAYEDSILQLLPALKEGTWRLLTPELATPVQHTPIMPLTTLQKRWLKALCLDERLSLFLDDAELALAMQALEGVEPLYKPEQFVFFDRSQDYAFSQPPEGQFPCRKRSHPMPPRPSQVSAPRPSPEPPPSSHNNKHQSHVSSNF